MDNSAEPTLPITVRLRSAAMSGVRVAAIQMCSGGDKSANFATARHLLTGAADRGARFAVLPEMFNNLGSGRVLREGAEPFEGPTTEFARAEAVRLGIWLLAGSFIELGADGTRHNTSVLVSPTGEIVAAYRKVHLFDVNVPGAEFRESDVTAPGTELVIAEVDGVGPVGLSICYDLRFPELYRILTLRGAKVIVVPAAFTAVTGPPHWEVLLRARAIENQVHVIAAGMHGTTSTVSRGGGVSTLGWHGHSMVIDPWGDVMERLDHGDGVVVAGIDPAYREEVRERLPSLAHRRPSAYVWP